MLIAMSSVTYNTYLALIFMEFVHVLVNICNLFDL